MKGLSNGQLGSIDVELKEAVCDGLVNALVNRVSGVDARGRTMLGGSPRRGIFAGQLLPRFDSNRTTDETTDIRVAAIGMDLVLDSAISAKLHVTPRFSVYVRVIPEWRELVGGGGELEFDFRLRPTIQQQIDSAIRTERGPALRAAGVERPDWKGMDETRRSKVRAARAQVLSEVRRKAYAAHNIRLLTDDPAEPLPSETENDGVLTDPNAADDTAPPPPPVSRLIREGREIPLNLVDPAPVPGKWRRLDLELPTLARLIHRTMADGGFWADGERDRASA